MAQLAIFRRSFMPVFRGFSLGLARGRRMVRRLQGFLGFGLD
jgi:hypothetical protein